MHSSLSLSPPLAARAQLPVHERRGGAPGLPSVPADPRRGRGRARHGRPHEPPPRVRARAGGVRGGDPRQRLRHPRPHCGARPPPPQNLPLGPSPAAALARQLLGASLSCRPLSRTGCLGQKASLPRAQSPFPAGRRHPSAHGLLRGQHPVRPGAPRPRRRRRRPRQRPLHPAPPQRLLGGARGARGPAGPESGRERAGDGA